MGKILAAYTFLCLCGIVAIHGAAVSTNSAKTLPVKKTPISTPTTKNVRVAYIYPIDLNSCRCQPFDKRCEVLVGKSLIRDRTSDCPEDHHYCCKKITQPQEPDIKNQSTQSIIKPANKTSNETKTSTPESVQRNQTFLRVHIHIPAAVEKVTVNSTSPNLEALPARKESKRQIKCVCKLRDQCESKYTDYSFGFHCSYDKVRCCEPQEKIQKELIKGLLEANLTRYNSTTNSNTTRDSEPLTKETPCVCVSPDECIGTNESARNPNPNALPGEKQKDALCPFNLIKCCGAQASRRSDTILTDQGEDSDDTLTTNSNERPDNHISGFGIDIIGQPAFRQPIQLPTLKIPVKGKTEAEPETVADPEKTLPPPELPTSYTAPAPPTTYYTPAQYAPAPAQPYWVPSPYARTPLQNPNGHRTYGFSSRSDVPPRFISSPSSPESNESAGFFSSIFNYFG